jgi:hypothetical protein
MNTSGSLLVCLQTARSINELYKKTPMRMAGSSVTDASGVMSSDAEDRRKEDEECDMQFSAEDQKE